MSYVDYVRGDYYGLLECIVLEIVIILMSVFILRIFLKRLQGPAAYHSVGLHSVRAAFRTTSPQVGASKRAVVETPLWMDEGLAVSLTGSTCHLKQVEVRHDAGYIDVVINQQCYHVINETLLRALEINDRPVAPGDQKWERARKNFSSASKIIWIE